LLELELPPEELADWLDALFVATVWPWKDRAATSEIPPDTTTAPAMIQRLILRIRARPASRAPTALGVTIRSSARDGRKR
jgi:hypothetical protein